MITWDLVQGCKGGLASAYESMWYVNKMKDKNHTIISTDAVK